MTFRGSWGNWKQVFWNRKQFSPSQLKQKERSSLLDLGSGFRLARVWEAPGGTDKAFLSHEGLCQPPRTGGDACMAVDGLPSHRRAY